MNNFINIDNKTKVYKTDVLIVGSGAGGATIADMLTKQGFEILMLEEGGSYPIKELKKPEEVFTKIWRHSGLTATLGKPNIAYAEGKAFGGSTEINSAIFQRPYEAVVQDWQDQYKLDDTWSLKNMNKYWDDTFAQMNVSYHEKYYADTTTLIDGAKKMGYKSEYLSVAMNTKEKDDRIYGCPVVGKQSMSKTLLPAAMKRGMKVITNCKLDKIIFKGKQATQAYCQVKKGNKNISIKVEFKYIFCCAGATNTPLILKRSGVKTIDFNNFQLHPTMKVFALFDKKIQDPHSIVAASYISEFMPNIRIAGSVVTKGFVGMALANNYHHTKPFLDNMENVGSYYVMIKPFSKGHFRFLPFANQWMDSPLIDYKLTDWDFEHFKKGLTYLTNAMFAAGAKIVMPDIANHDGWRSMTDFKKDMSRTAQYNLMSVHLMASCPPSGVKNLGVTNPEGRVWGYDNFYIADASQIPTALGCNPQATVMAIAKKYATQFVAHYK